MKGPTAQLATSFLFALFCALQLHFSVSFSARGRSSLKPCLSRYLMVKQQLHVYGEIRDNPNFIPECEKDGYLWKPAQCEYPNTETCFCVDRETGIRIPESTRHDVIREYMDCDGGEYATHISDCEERAQRYKKIRDVVGVDHIFDYFPVCTPNGTFTAMQRNDRFFFCVDMKTGEKIPRTQSERELPITEEICTSFGMLWKRFQDSNKFGSAEEVTGPNSCRFGTVYDECGCKTMCQPGQNMMMQRAEECAECRPVCRCPTGSFELSGQCVSNEECMAAGSYHNIISGFRRQQQKQSWEEFIQKNGDREMISFLRDVQQGGGEVTLRTDESNSAIDLFGTDQDSAVDDYSGDGDQLVLFGEYEAYDDHFAYGGDIDDGLDLPNRAPEEITEYYDEGNFYEDEDFVQFETLTDHHEDAGLYVRLNENRYKKSSQQT